MVNLRMFYRRRLLVLACLPTLLGAAPGEYFGIHVINEPKGWNS